MAKEKVVSANDLLLSVRDDPEIDGKHFARFKEHISRAPDAVPVVRCKDCKNRDEITKECKHPKAVGWDVIIPEDNDFCSYGERRERNG